MPWTYTQATGIFERPCPLHSCKPSRFDAYSGKKGQWRNAPAHQGTPNLGPIPRGEYRIGVPYMHPKLGEVTMNLEPIGHNALKRTAFRIHGDNVIGDASTGCIILKKEFRDAIARAVKNGDNVLTVVE